MRSADFPYPCARLMCPAARQVHQHLLHVRPLHALKRRSKWPLSHQYAKRWYTTFHLPNGLSGPRQAAPVRAIHSRALKNVVCAPPRRPLQGSSCRIIRSHCASVKPCRSWVILLVKRGITSMPQPSRRIQRSYGAFPPRCTTSPHQTFRTRSNLRRYRCQQHLQTLLINHRHP